MKWTILWTGVLCFVIGGTIGSTITYYKVRCQTSGLNIQLNSGSENPGVTITKIGDNANN